MRPAVAYIRVSKPKQGRSGLGLEAQQVVIGAFCKQHGYKIEAEYREVETGKGADALGGVDTYLIHKMMAARVTTAR